MLRKLLGLALLTAAASATVTINATFKDPSGNPVPFAYLEVQLQNCGNNVPVSGLNTIVVKDMRFTPSQLPATVYGNNEITCGNSYSTLYHITAWANSSTKIAGDLNYDICSTAFNCLVSSSPTWDLAQSQPFTGAPPPPGYASIFGNPILSQTIIQPLGTALNLLGTVNLNGSPVCTQGNSLCGGGGGGGTNPVGTSGQINVNIVSGVPTVSLANPITTPFNVTGPSSFAGASFVSQATVNPGVFNAAQENAPAYSGLNGGTPGALQLSVQGNFSTDGLAGAVIAPPTSAVHQIDGVAGYVETSANSGSGVINNAVGGYFQCRATGNNAFCWGMNAYAGDAVGVTGAQVKAAEFDTNIFGAPVYFNAIQTDGANLGSGGFTMPAAIPAGFQGNNVGAAMFDVMTPRTGFNSNTYWAWPLGLNFRRASVATPGGASAPAIQIDGYCVTGAVPCGSAFISFTGYDASNVGHAGQISGDAFGDLIFKPNPGNTSVFFGGLNLPGATSGSSNILAPATGGGTINLPTGSGTLCLTTTCTGSVSGTTPNGGLVATGTTLGLLLTCSSNQVEQWNGSAWGCASISGAVSGQVGGQPTYGTGSSSISSSPGTLYVSFFCGSTTSCNPGGGITDESHAIQAAVTQLKNSGASGATGHIVDDMCGTQTWSNQPFTGFAGLFETQSNCSITNTHIIMLDGMSTVTLPNSFQWHGSGGNGFAQIPTNTWVQACNLILNPCANGGFQVQQGAIASTTYAAASNQLTITLTSGAPFTTCGANGVCSQVTTPSLTAVNTVQQYRLLCINNSSIASNNGCWTYKTTTAFGAPQAFVVNVPGSGLASCASSCGIVYLETPMLAIGNGGGGGAFWSRAENLVLNGGYLPGVGGVVNGQGQEGTGFKNIQVFDTPTYYMRLDQSSAYGGAPGGDTNSGPYDGTFAGNMTPIVCTAATCACLGDTLAANGGHGSCSSHVAGTPGTVNQGDWMACGGSQGTTQGSFASPSPDPCTNPNFVGFLTSGASQNQGPAAFGTHVTSSIADKSLGGGVPIKQLQGSGAITGTSTPTTGTGIMCIGSHCAYGDTHVEYFSTAYEICGNVARNATWQEAYSVATAGGALIPLTAGVIIDGGFSAFQTGGTGVDIGQSGAAATCQDISIRGLNVGLGLGNALEDNISGNSCSDATFSYQLGHGANPLVVTSCSTATNLEAPSVADTSLTTFDLWTASAGGIATGLHSPTTPSGVTQSVVSTPAGGATAYANALPGISTRQVSASTDTILASDCNPVRIEYTFSGSVTETLPTATSLAVPTCTFKLVNPTGGATTSVSFVSSWTINNASAGSFSLVPGQAAVFFVDGASNWAADLITSSGGGANAALSNLSGVAINTAMLPGVDNSIALGSSSFRYTNVFATAITGGIAGTSSLVITGAGSTSGTATITWPAVAGTATNPISFSNGLSLPNGASATPALTFANSAGTGFWSPAGNTNCWSSGGSGSAGFCLQGGSGFLSVADNWSICFSRTATATGSPCGGAIQVVGSSTTEALNVSTPILIPQCKVIAAVNMTVTATPVTYCSFTLPNSAQTWAWMCKGTYSTSTAADTFTLGYAAAQAPIGVTADAIIYSTNAGTSTSASVTTTTSTSNTTILTGASVSSVTNVPFSTSGVIQANAASGTLVLTGMLTGTSPSGTVNPGTTCQIY